MYHFIFKKGRTVIEAPLPCIPFEITEGVDIHTVNISEIGSVYLGGKKTPCRLSCKLLFPGRDYYFAKMEDEPKAYYDLLKKWSHNNDVIRFVVTDSPINLEVLVESVTYSVQDMTKDAYITIKMAEHTELKATRTVATGNKKIRTKVSGANNLEHTHKIVYGDRLCLLCRNFYGDESAKVYNAVARYNGLPNPHLIPIGTPVKFPPREKLGV